MTQENGKVGANKNLPVLLLLTSHYSCASPALRPPFKNRTTHVWKRTGGQGITSCALIHRGINSPCLLLARGKCNRNCLCLQIILNLRCGVSHNLGNSKGQYQINSRLSLRENGIVFSCQRGPREMQILSIFLQRWNLAHGWKIDLTSFFSLIFSNATS